MIVQNAGGGEHGGGVAVMAAGMHHIGHFAGKGQPRLFLHGQGVNIRPQGHAAARALLAMDQRHDSGGHRGLNLIHTVFRQLFPDEGGGHKLITPDLGMPMNLPAKAHNFIIAGLGSIFDHAHIVASYYHVPSLFQENGMHTFILTSSQ